MTMSKGRLAVSQASGDALVEEEQQQQLPGDAQTFQLHVQFVKPCARLCNSSGRSPMALRSDDCWWRLPLLRAAPCWRPARRSRSRWS